MEARQFKDWDTIRLFKVGFVHHWKTLALARSVWRQLIVPHRPRVVVKSDRKQTTDWATGRKAWIALEKELVYDQYIVDETIAHSRRNLAEIVELCRARGVKLVLCTEPVNLRYPPTVTAYNSFSSEPHFVDHGKPSESKALKELLVTVSGLLAAKQYDEAIALLEPALDRFNTDRRIAAIHFLYGSAWDGLGKFDKAREEYIKASDSDPFVIRIPSALNDAIRSMADPPNVVVADIEKAFQRSVDDGIPDYRMFYNNCHYLDEKTYEIAAVEIEQTLDRNGLIGPRNIK